MKECFLLVILSAILNIGFSQSDSTDKAKYSDTIFVHIRGDFKKKEVYMLKYGSRQFGIFGKENSKRDIAIPINSNDLENTGGLPLQILKKKIFGFDEFKFYFIYDKERKHIFLYHYRNFNNKPFFQAFYMKENYISVMPFIH